MPPAAAVTVEENLKLLAACCIFNGDKDQVAAYMGITKNAVNKRYAKLVADEKQKAVKLGMLEGAGTPTKKRVATSNGDSESAKKLKTGDVKDEGGEEVETKVEDFA